MSRILATTLVFLLLVFPVSAQTRLRVLGTAQDGGFPHAACSCERCDAARAEPSAARNVASLALIVPGEDREQVFLIDATPDVRAQLDLLDNVRDAPNGVVDRAPIDGVLLTHAHIGHYTGLMFFGFEAVHTRGLAVWCTPRMAEFLRTNGPWDQLVRIGNIEIHEITPGETFEVGGVAVVPILAPHRDEYSDTVAFAFVGDERTVLYMPDTEPWERWERPIEDVIDELGVDVLLVDGTFYSMDELPKRGVRTIGHPLMTSTMDRFQERVEDGSLTVIFTHLNHSNPAIIEDSPEAQEVERRGYRVAREPEELGL